jgi:uncharacterized protein (TIGR00290 family)
MPTPRPVAVSWSSGKDSAWTLHRLRLDPRFEPRLLVTTVSEPDQRVTVHRIPRAWLEAQARAAGLPLLAIPLPDPCPNEIYAAAMTRATAELLDRGVDALAFGDLFLEDVRAYREARLAGTGLEPLFPLWGEDTARLSRAAGLRATLCSVDLRHLPADYCGRTFDDALLDQLPAGVDPCGERGEFHTFVTDGPMFRSALAPDFGPVHCANGFAHLQPGRS